MSDTQSSETTSTPQTFRATGLTCGHCAHAVREELGAVPGVDAVEVEVVSGGESIVRVTASRELGPTSRRKAPASTRRTPSASTSEHAATGTATDT